MHLHAALDFPNPQFHYNYVPAYNAHKLGQRLDIINQVRYKIIQFLTEYNYKYDMSSPGFNTFVRQLNKVLSAHVLFPGVGNFRFQTIVSVQR